MGRAVPSAPPPHDGACHDKYHWENPGQEDDEPPDRPTVAALVDPAHPLRGTIAGERARGSRSTAPVRSSTTTVAISSFPTVRNCTRQTAPMSRAPSLLPSRSAPRTRPRPPAFALTVGRKMTAGRAPGSEASAAESAASGVSRALDAIAPKPGRGPCGVIATIEDMSWRAVCGKLR